MMRKENGLGDICNIYRGKEGKISRSTWLEYKNFGIKGEIIDETRYNEARF